jgi:hypothetical protein
LKINQKENNRVYGDGHNGIIQKPKSNLLIHEELPAQFPHFTFNAIWIEMKTGPPLKISRRQKKQMEKGSDQVD